MQPLFTIRQQEGQDTPGEFGRWLHEHRLAARLTREQLANEASLPWYVIQKIELGYREPIAEMRKRIVEALKRCKGLISN